MTERVARVTPEFVMYIPEELAEGIVYVSIQYKVVAHLCCCGCGEKVVTPLDPAQWSVTYDGETISLDHSIAGGDCNSHYFIKRGTVSWAPTLTERQLALAARRDQAAVHGRPMPAGEDTQADAPIDAAHISWWTKMRRRGRRK
jgi:uncharacterized protein DUF6527